MEWTGERRARAHDENTAQGYYGGWNNKAQADYNNAPNSYGYYLGPAHRAHVIDEYLATHDNLTYEDVRDLALNIATTDSFGSGGNTWSFVADAFTAAVAADATPGRQAAVDMIADWDGHFVAGGPSEWRMGTHRADAWVLQDAWIKEVIRLTFEDEFSTAGLDFSAQPTFINFNVLLRALAGPDAALPTFYDWFQDMSGSGKPTTADEIIVLALDNVLAAHRAGRHTTRPAERSSTATTSSARSGGRRSRAAPPTPTASSSTATVRSASRACSPSVSRVRSVPRLLRSGRLQPALLQHDPGLRPVHAAPVPAVRLIDRFSTTPPRSSERGFLWGNEEVSAHCGRCQRSLRSL